MCGCCATIVWDAEKDKTPRSSRASGRALVWVRGRHDGGGAGAPPPQQVRNGFNVFIKRCKQIFHFTVKPSAGAGGCADRRFAWPWRRAAIIVMCRCCNVAGENGCKTMFVKRMEGNFRFTVKPSEGPGDALTGASPDLGGGLQSL